MKRTHSSFRYGMVGGVILILTYIISMVVFPASTMEELLGFRLFSGDILVYPIQCFLFYIFASQAAQQQFESQRHEMEPLVGVASEGRGAAMVIAVVGWLFVIGRWLWLDLSGGTVLIEPFSLFCSIVTIGALALIIGSFGANSVVKKYKHYESYTNY
jgi:hypothetical protein